MAKNKRRKLIMDGIEIDPGVAVKRYKAMRSFANIEDRHAAIFEDRFGINDGIPKTYETVARKFNISGERVRQLCALVFHKIGLMP